MKVFIIIGVVVAAFLVIENLREEHCLHRVEVIGTCDAFGYCGVLLESGHHIETYYPIVGKPIYVQCGSLN